MLNISFYFDDPIAEPDEYTMGYMNIEYKDQVLRSEDLSGRGLMMVFFRSHHYWNLFLNLMLINQRNLDLLVKIVHLY